MISFRSTAAAPTQSRLTRVQNQRKTPAELRKSIIPKTSQQTGVANKKNDIKNRTSANSKNVTAAGNLGKDKKGSIDLVNNKTPEEEENKEDDNACDNEVEKKFEASSHADVDLVDMLGNCFLFFFFFVLISLLSVSINFCF